MDITTTERGWAGHYCCASRCLFRRNTLVSNGDRHIVVSTVGNMVSGENGPEPIGVNASPRWFETMVFKATPNGSYLDSDVHQELHTGEPWAMCADTASELGDSADNNANDMHERHVQACVEQFDAVWESGSDGG